MRIKRLTENEYERFERLSSRLRNITSKEMASEEGISLMKEVDFHMGRAADYIDFKLQQADAS